MFAALITAAAAVAAATAGLPYVHVPAIEIPIPGTGSHLPLQPFGIIVAAGVMIGVEICTRYARRRGVDEDDTRSLVGWVIGTGFVGAHVFDVLAYQTDKLAEDPLLLIKLWAGISSYGGFIGAVLGFWIFMRRHPGRWPALFADISVAGGVTGFLIGRIGCTIVSDHVGDRTDFVLGVDYPPSFVQQHLGIMVSGDTRLHNLGLYELLYLLVVDAVILGLAFGKEKTPASLLAVVTVLLYAPVRFFLDFLRLEGSDPRYAGLTFAQWASIAFFLGSIYALTRVLRSGKVAPLLAELGGKRGGFREGMAPPAENGRAAAAGAGDKRGKKA